MENPSLEAPLIPSLGDKGWSGKVLPEVKKQLWLAGPLVVTSLLQSAIQVVSLIFVGHLGEVALSGAAMAFSFAAFTGFSVMLGLTSALDTFCGQSFGAREYHMLGIHLQRAMLVVTLVSIPVAIVWAYTGEILIALGQDPEISIEAGNFARWFIPTVLAYGFYFCHMKFLQNQNIVAPTVIITGFTSLLHIFACWILVYKSGLGNKGAALAGDISNWMNVLLLAAYVRLSPSCKKTWTGFSRDALRDIFGFLKLAIPSTIMVCLVYGSFEMIVLLAGLLPNPKLETSVMSICLNISQFLFMVPFGLSAAVSTRVANELGAGHPQAAHLAMWIGVIMSAVQGSIMGILMILLRKALGYAFSNEEEVVKYAEVMLPIIALSNLLDGVQYVLAGVARGCGWQTICAILNLGAYYVVGIPFSVLFAFFLHLRGMGLWFGLISGLLVQMVSILVIAIFTNWEKEANKAKDRVQKAAAAVEAK